jgi:hypothetical protein
MITHAVDLVQQNILLDRPHIFLFLIFIGGAVKVNDKLMPHVFPAGDAKTRVFGAEF